MWKCKDCGKEVEDKYQCCSYCSIGVNNVPGMRFFDKINWDEPLEINVFKGQSSVLTHGFVPVTFVEERGEGSWFRIEYKCPGLGSCAWLFQLDGFAYNEKGVYAEVRNIKKIS